MKLIDKHVVITGGTSGIGRQIINTLYPTNRISVIGRCSAKLARVKALSSHIHTYQADLANLADTHQAAAQIAEEHKAVDVLINNAAVQYHTPLPDPSFDARTIQEEATVNFISACILTHFLLPKLQSAEASIILNINSGLALSPKKSSAVYCSTKGALNIFSQSLRYQLADTNVTVMQAFLPLVDTDLSRGYGSGKLSTEEAAYRIIEGIERKTQDNYIGKVKLLRFLLRTAPSIAHKIMKNA